MFSFAAAVAEWLRRADRHRNAVLAALLAKASVEALFGLATSAAAMVALTAWLAAGLLVGRAMPRVADPGRARRLRYAVLTADITGVALLQYLSGGTAWFGALCYVFLIIVSAVAMDGRALAAFTALSALAYGVPLFGEAFGWLPPYPLVGGATPRATPAQAMAVWTVAAVVLAGTATVLHGFVRLVRRGAEWHQQLVDQAPMIVIMLGRDGRVLSANPAANAAAAARGDGPMPGRHYHTLVSAEAHPGVDAAIAASLAGGVRRAVVPTTRPDGTVRWMDFMTNPVREHGAHDGPVVGVLVMARDATEERTAAAALEAREARFRALAQHASDVTCVVDEAGRYTYLSPSTQRVFGADPAALLGKLVTDDLHPDDLEGVREGMRRAKRAPGQPVTVHYRFRHADGSWRQIESVGCALLHEPAVRGYVFNSRDVTERAELEAQLTRQAYHDALTGLANRARFGERLAGALARARAAGDPGRVAVLVLDLDGFKVVNDSLGHAAGDRLLVEVAERLLSATRGCDTVARLGGDEFAVLLEGVQTDADATVVAERVVAALRPGFLVDGRQAYVGTSVGIARAGAHGDGAALAPGGDAEDPVAAVLRDADAAMYRAKARGKGRWALFEPAMHAAAVERLALEGDLRLALERDELVLVYQPVVELETGRTVAAEALVRWRHPRRGLVGPAEFIPFAEETGLIVPLGRQVLARACRQAAAWQRAGLGAGEEGAPLVVAVNVSGQQLEAPDFVGEVAAALAESGLAAGALTLEITEYSVVERPDAVRERLTALRALGVRVAIDDFGTGYSALSQLQQFPIDVLKVDRAFVERVTRGGSHAAVTRTLVALGDALGVRTVAEGIETEEQRAYLRQLGCRLGQGYLFARPLEPEALAARLRAEAGAAAPAPPAATAPARAA